MELGIWPSGRAPAWPVQGPDFTPQHHRHNVSLCTSIPQLFFSLNTLLLRASTTIFFCLASGHLC